MPPSSATSTTLKRIHREIADLKKEDLGAIKLGPSDDNLFFWKATLPGPEGSVYEGGAFDVDINLERDYPFSAPKLTFRTRIYHMNISDRGGICIDILKHNWSPALSLFKVVLSLSSLLTDPNPKDPLVSSIATEYLRHRAQHDRTAREWTQLYAKPPPPPPPAPLPSAAPTPSVPNTRSKGKGRAAPAPIMSGSSSRPTASDGVITIDDSDEERAPAARTNRKQTTGKRKRGGPGGKDSDGTNATEVSDRPSSRRRTAGDGSSNVSARTASNDVIVIED